MKRAPKAGPAQPNVPRPARTRISFRVAILTKESRVSGTLDLDGPATLGTLAFLGSRVLFEVGEEVAIECEIEPGTTIQMRARIKDMQREQGQGRVPGMGIELVGLPKT